jgi:Skp family chaperone for outer membrane proteins
MWRQIDRAVIDATVAEAFKIMQSAFQSIGFVDGRSWNCDFWQQKDARQKLETLRANLARYQGLCDQMR